MLQETKLSEKPPVIAMIGRPNVGKSSLFNRITRTRKALVAPQPGLTRDRRVDLVEYEEYRFVLIDTGGMGFKPDGAFSREIDEQIELAVGEADIIWLIVDKVEGLNPYDIELYRWVSRFQKDVLVVVNKVDTYGRHEDLSEFYALGCSDVFGVSASHGHGISGVLERSNEFVPLLNTEEEPVEEKPEMGDGPKEIRIAFLGKPNVGKSSLVNSILGSDRMIVSDVPGTTRETVDLTLQFKGDSYVIMDTAGLRKKAKTVEYLEKIGALSSLNALYRTHVAILVLDASGEISDQDAKIAGYIQKQYRGVVIVINKWDQVGRNKSKEKEVMDDIAHKLRFLDYAPIVKTSAVKGEGVTKLFREIAKVYEQFNRKIQTADINRVVKLATTHQPPPAKGSSLTKIFYGTQVSRRPPRFSFITNHPQTLGESYKRFFENQFRFHFGFTGTPLKVEWKSRRDELKPRKKPVYKKKLKSN